MPSNWSWGHQNGVGSHVGIGVPKLELVPSNWSWGHQIGVGSHVGIGVPKLAFKLVGALKLELVPQIEAGAPKLG